ncbi:MAG: dienelactone hydrolase family protein [Pirellulales bacterium]
MRLRSLVCWSLFAAACGPLTAAPPEPLPDTAALTLEGDIASQMIDGVDRFLLRETAASVAAREKHYQRDFASPEKYTASLTPNRARLAKILGVVDERLSEPAPEIIRAVDRGPGSAASGERFVVRRLRWPVFRQVHGHGLLLVPTRTDAPPVAEVIVLPDAGQTPEMLVGLAPGIPSEAQTARLLAESGCRVVVPAIVDRARDLSIDSGGARKTGLPNREFLYRPAFELGRHVLGYEVQQVLALVDWFERTAPAGGARIGVCGYGEGGQIALLAAALDPRIDAALVSGHFGPREGLWQTPIDRNVFGLLEQFGDAELAALIAPRKLIVEHRAAPLWQSEKGQTPGMLERADNKAVEAEAARARALVAQLPAAKDFLQVTLGDARDSPEGPQALAALLQAVAPGAKLVFGKPLSADWPKSVAEERRRRQFDELVADTQWLLREGEYTRDQFWAKADRGSRSVEKWQETTKPYRDYFRDQVIGRFDHPLLPPNVRTRKVYDQPTYTGYEVVLDVFPDVIAYGILLLPKDIAPGERRPVVVCQHGLEGRPQDVADPAKDEAAYHRYACRLAERGFITYAPQNIYIFQDRFRTLQRKANPLGKTLFSIMVPQHQQATDWLASLPFVDPQRIAFYGLSYGGKTAMRVPALVDRYCLSICSADFNEWVWKNASVRSPYSYAGMHEYEIFEWDLGSTFNYAEMAGLIAPRPFMVERGHRDGVAPDHTVAYEFAKVRLLYADLKIPERTEIEFFDGPHTINGVGTFDFLHRHLNWPKRQ